MRLIVKLLKILVALVIIGVAGAYAYLVAVPPELLQVGSGYASKTVCSSVALSGRDADQVLVDDVLSEGNPLLKGFGIDLDDTGTVRAAFLKYVGPVRAMPRPGLGCVTVPGGDLAAAAAIRGAAAPTISDNPALWPEGEGVAPRADLAAILADETLAGHGMRAIVVVKDGRIVAERYGEGFDAGTRLLGWSMTKTVTAVLVGTAIEAGRLGLADDGLFPEWAGDGRAKITIADLMAMSSGLAFNESYGDVSDVNRMLFLEPDMAKFAASLPLEHPPGSTYNYSTGTTVLLSRLWQDAIGEAALDWPRKAVFGPLGMTSAVLEADAVGTYVGGSYLYATGHDWARFGQMLLNGGAWNGRQVVSRDFVDWMVAPAETNPAYGQGQIWRVGPDDTDFDGDDLRYGIPDDAFWLLGHDGQSVAVIPSAGLVVVRMGLTPSRFGYRPQGLVSALVKALAE
jgi:CubicO group peptidase (beta-lactamase class C family)